MPIKLEDEYGRPWTASANLGWLTLIAVLTLGFAAPLLGVYLSLWIWSKGRSAWPLICFSLCIISFLPLPFVLLELHHSILVDVLSDLGSILWIVAPFTLRYEIQRYYKEAEGWEIEIGKFWTFLWSALYINYCLNPLTFSERDSPTTLDLRK
jgi:hypothetical protein